MGVKNRTHISRLHASEYKEHQFRNKNCYSNSGMKITNQGLCSIALLTGALWGCILVEKLTIAHARADADRALSEIRALQLKKHILPAASPVERPKRARPALG